MAHQSGIRVSDDLLSKFRVELSEDATLRTIKVGILNEELYVTGEHQLQGTLLEDLERVPELLNDTEPCYVLVRLDYEENRWLLATYVPDNAQVRDKMLYASTKASLTKGLGESYFVDNMFGTVRSEFSSEGYQTHRRHVESTAPLTEREEEMIRIKDMENSVMDAPTMDSRRSHVSQNSYPLQDQAEDAMKKFAKGMVNFVLLCVDSEEELVKLVREDTLQSHGELAQVIPKDMPTYTLYWYDSTTSIFIYTCPLTTSVRERMVCSTFRQGFTESARDMDINVDIRLEFDNPVEITPAALSEEVSAKASSAQPPAVPLQKFKRPAPPNRRPRAMAAPSN
ncbi:actin depolymerizing protein [Coemansia reversa NRRL 1564]|uniref:Actin depolymerizing protein n=1 Tax=Coemansia reversa (strain ATCC 12441 / NRRL 1564) TaxID=763665 RepID=A0A2G5BHQ6_COERN|nr:actin depolymerizing protein [Coemansia reversa NRRL 1564]|eukprot:PIA18550.1 actin depolymerizing protein [Coemansia reversa NRRL 1564]